MSGYYECYNPTTDEKDKKSFEIHCDTACLSRPPMSSVANSMFMNASNGTATGENKESDDSSDEDEPSDNYQNERVNSPQGIPGRANRPNKISGANNAPIEYRATSGSNGPTKPVDKGNATQTPKPSTSTSAKSPNDPRQDFKKKTCTGKNSGNIIVDKDASKDPDKHGSTAQANDLTDGKGSKPNVHVEPVSSVDVKAKTPKRPGTLESLNNIYRSSFWNCQLIIVSTAIVCIAVGIVLVFYLRDPDPTDPINPKHLVNGYKKYCTKLNELSRNFHSQSDDFWKSVRVVAKPIFDDPEPISPAVIIFVANTESEFRAARCLSRKVAAAVTEAFGSKPAVTINGGMKDTPGKVKLRIDEIVTEKLSAGGRVVIVDGIEKLHGEAALMFHSFCHNKNAPFKRAMFIFTLFAGEQSSSHEGVDDVVEKVLKGRWSQHIDRDTIDPLLGHIGNNNVFISSESDRVLEDSECV